MRTVIIFILIASCIFVKAQTEVIAVPDSLPEFDGGTTSIEFYIAASINYPVISREFNQQGTVFVSFLVDTSALVKDVSVMKSSGHAPLDQEAVRVAKNLPFTRSALREGKKVPYKTTIPINFKMEEISPNHGSTNNYLVKANKFYDDAKYYDALDNYRIYTKHFPKDYEAVTNLGYCYIKTRQSEKGCALLHKIKKEGSNLGDNHIKQYCTN